MKKANGHEKGFTLLELLIVISIIAVLSVALVLVLNPAEALKKSRDAQRISDLSTMKTALGLYLTSTTTPSLAGTANAGCKAAPSTAWAAVVGPKIYYSLPGSAVVSTTLDGATIAVGSQDLTTASSTLTDGTGWIPVNFDTLTGGSPISNLPLDPTNAFGGTDTGATSLVTSSSLMYRYACSVTPLAFELDAVLESTAYTVTDNKMKSDGGNTDNYYEVGTNLKILGQGGASSNNF